jgi:hypothetical protein
MGQLAEMGLTHRGICVTFLLEIRACTGFDGDFEVWEAIRSSGTAYQPGIKFKRRQ